MPFTDFIEQRLKSDPVARKILAMDETATRELDTQVLERILIGDRMAIVGEANQIVRPVTMFDHGIDGEVESKDNDGKASGHVERAPTVRKQASPRRRPGYCIRKWQSPERAAQIVTPFQGSHCDG